MLLVLGVSGLGELLGWLRKLSKNNFDKKGLKE